MTCYILQCVGYRIDTLGRYEFPPYSLRSLWPASRLWLLRRKQRRVGGWIERVEVG